MNQNRAKHGFKKPTADSFFARQPQIFENVTLVARRKEHFQGFLVSSTPSKKRCFGTQEFTRFLSMVLSQRRATHSDVSLMISRI